MTTTSWTFGIVTLGVVAFLDAANPSVSLVSVQIAVGVVFLAKVIYHAAEIVITRRDA